MKLLFLLLILPIFVQAQTITTFAGNGVFGYWGDGGIATAAALGTAIGVRLDNSGNILISEQDLVRNVNISTNTIMTIAGDTMALTMGNGGPATDASVVAPFDIGVDVSGNYYISDNGSGEIRKVNISTGIITDFAGILGGGTHAGDGGPATHASFTPAGIFVDTTNNYLYLSDEFGHKVRRINMITDTITAYAGTGTNGFSGDGGPATAAEFSRIWGITFDEGLNLYLADFDNARIRRVDGITGIVTTIAGNGISGYSGDGGPASNASLSMPTDLCTDKCGNVYFSQDSGSVVRKINMTTGVITTVAGNGTRGYSGDGGPATDASLNYPYGLCIDGNNNLYIGDYYNNRVRKVHLPSDTVSETGCNIALGTKQITKSKISECKIFPNPATNNVTIECDAKIKQILIVTLVGNKVYKEEFDAQTAEINVASLTDGIYLVYIQDEEGNKAVKKIIRE